MKCKKQVIVPLYAYASNYQSWGGLSVACFSIYLKIPSISDHIQLKKAQPVDEHRENGKRNKILKRKH